ncbi:MAG: IS110 family transposase [Caulobacter sp.]|nr:IS110 family transposase [Caulobacter sp.]
MVEVYVGLDVSDKSTHLCVVDGSGATVWSGACATDPDVIARTLKTRAAGLVRVILETGPLSAFLYHGLVERGVPAICVCARHAKGVLSARVNKSDPHDAEGLAQMARTGWFKQVRIKAEATHMDRASLKIREQLIAARQSIAGQLRGLLKLFGLRLGQVTTPGRRRERLTCLFAQKPGLEAIMAPLIESLEALEVQIARSTRQLAAQAATDPVTVRLMTVPGVGPITALVFKSSIEDPERFSRGEDAGAFAGLAPRRSQSGERDYKGRISRAGDPMLRRALYEAANVLLGRVKRPCALRDWGLKLAETKGTKRARVAVARKLAVLLHRLWRSETDFRWA